MPKPIVANLDSCAIPEPNSGCRLWTGYADKDGYGRWNVKKRPRLVHRLMWEDANGPIPVGLQVLHRCDVPSCVNPDHLFLGTHDDNMADRRSKGRYGNTRPSRKDRTQ